MEVSGFYFSAYFTLLLFSYKQKEVGQCDMPGAIALLLGVSSFVCQTFLSSAQMSTLWKRQIMVMLLFWKEILVCNLPPPPVWPMETLGSAALTLKTCSRNPKHKGERDRNTDFSVVFSACGHRESVAFSEHSFRQGRHDSESATHRCSLG